MKLKYYGFGVAILTLAVGCGGEIVGGSGDTSKDAGKPPPVADSGGGRVGDADAGPPVVDSAPPDTGTDTAPVDAGPDNGSPSTTYPAFMPFIPGVLDNGGPVLASPQIVTVTWTADTLHATWEAFGDDIGSTAYWKTTTSEYGVGPAVSGATNHVEIATAPPTAWSDTDIVSFVQTNASSTATSGWPAPNSNIVYVIYVPTSTSATFSLHQGTGTIMACMNGTGGYHDNVNVSGFGDIAYAVVLQCGPEGLPVTDAASHELIEAATDPYPSDNPAYTGFNDATYMAWDLFQTGSAGLGQTEVGDMCETYFYPDSFGYTDPTLGGVQRTWSTVSAQGGHAPCVPAETTAYFNVTPLNQEAVTINSSAFPLGGTPKAAATGYSIPVGKSKTFAVGFYSDGPTSGPWDITVEDLGDQFAGQYFTAVGKSSVTTSVDVAQGQNGNVAYVTVTANGYDQTKSDLILVKSELPGSTCGFRACRSYMPILISGN